MALYKEHYAKSVFFIPVWFGQLDRFKVELERLEIWEPTPMKDLWFKQLYKYAGDLCKDIGEQKKRCFFQKNDVETVRRKAVFSSYTLKDLGMAEVYMYEDHLKVEGKVTLEQVRFSAFATGTGFLEFWVSYENMTPDEIADFAWCFKHVRGTSDIFFKKFTDGRRFMYDAAKALLPESAASKMFFTENSPVTWECSCYHMIHVEDAIPDDATVRETVLRLARSYRSDMTVADSSEFDLFWKVTEGEYWGGSPNGLVNIVYDEYFYRDEELDYVTHKMKQLVLDSDYYFLYLMLLNQRYSCVEYIRMVSLSLECTPGKVDELSKRIIQLQTVFTFNTISNDTFVQKLYENMQEVLDIKNLLKDVRENEKQLEMLIRNKQASDESLSNKALNGLAMLTLVSTALDFAGLLDRGFDTFNRNTWISVVTMCGAAAYFLIILIRSMKQ